MKAKKIISAALAALMLLSAVATAESGYNPFDTEATANSGQVSTTDVFGVSDATGSVPTVDAGGFSGTDPFERGNSSSEAAASSSYNPFATAAPTAAAPVGVGVGSAVDLFNLGTATPAPTQGSSIAGYNPFDPNASAAANAATAVVPTNVVMFVSASSLKIMREPKEKTRTLFTATFGQQLTVTATQGEWARVQNAKGATGFCLLSGLSSADPNSMSKTVYAQLKTVPVYNTPSRKARRLRTLNLGDTVTMTAITSDGMWARVTDGSNYGFVPSVMLDETPASEGTAVWCAAASTPVMVNPDNWIEISALSFGQEVRLLGYTANNTMARIKSSKGYVAYCSASALSTANPANLDTPVYTQVSGKILYRSASDDAKHTQVGKNAQMTLLGVDNTQTWGLVKFKGHKYYVPYLYLGASKLGKNYKVLVTTQDAPLYRNATEIITTLPAGTRLNLTGAAAGAAGVAIIPDATITQSASGYVMLNCVRSE